MGSFKKIVLPAAKALFKGIVAVGLKRASTATVILYDAWKGMIADNEITGDELRDFGRIGRAAMGDASAKITKEEAKQMTITILTKGLGMGTGEAELLLTSIAKSKKEGVASNEIGIKPEDEDPDDA